jgi:hypothetical protein
MEVLVTFLLVIVMPGLAAGIAHRKGRSGFGFFLLTLLAGLVPGAIALNISQNEVVGSLVGLGFAALAMLTAGLSRSAGEVAAQTGAFGDYIKCPQCAEPIRREARLCKHCQSVVEPA